MGRVLRAFEELEPDAEAESLPLGLCVDECAQQPEFLAPAISPVQANYPSFGGERKALWRQVVAAHLGFLATIGMRS